MTKRKCGTCRNFEDVGLAGSGWCTHTNRRELHNLVMVRKSELACRNTWDQDLWEPRVDQALADAEVDDHDALQASAHELEIPAPTVDDASQPTAANRVSRNDYTDKITSIAVPLGLPESRPRAVPASRQFELPSPNMSVFEGVSDPRTAVRAAQQRRQQQLDAHRLRAEPNDNPHDSLGATPSGTPSPAPTPPLAGEDDLPPVRVTRSDRAPRDLPLPLPTPPLFGTPAGRQPRTQPQPQPQPPSVTVRAPLQPAAAAGATEPLPIGAVTARLKEEAARQPMPPPDPPVRPSPPREALRVDQRAADVHDRRAPADTPLARPAGGAPRRPLPLANIDDWPGLEDPRYAVRPPEQQPARNEIQAPLDVDPIDRIERLHSVPRCCGTCRDYRRDGDSQRGWCDNRTAFSDRRMVESSALACRSSFGAWWLPQDALWLERADITHHGRPTPLMDVLSQDLMLGKHDVDARDLHFDLDSD